MLYIWRVSRLRCAHTVIPIFFLFYLTFPLLVDYWKTKVILCLNDKIAQSDVFARILYAFFFLRYFVLFFSHAHFPSSAASDPDIPVGSTGKNA